MANLAHSVLSAKTMRGFRSWLASLFPPLRWLPEIYVKGALWNRSKRMFLLVLLSPPCCSAGHGVRAAGGMSPIDGLYASAVPLMVYALFGSSRHESPDQQPSLVCCLQQPLKKFLEETVAEQLHMPAWQSKLLL